MKHGIVKVWVNEFDDATVKRVVAAIDEVTETGQQVLPVFISSLGGPLYPLFAIMDVFKTCPVPIITVAIGTAQSAAVDLLSCGTKGHRYVGELTTIMVHDAGDAFPTYKKNTELQAYAVQSQRERDLSFDVFAKNTGKDRRFWNEWLDKRKGIDVFLSAQEAVDLGIADHVGVPQFNVTSDIEMIIPGKK
jgi:ATP-dependent Clp protease protease subunit